MRPKRLSELVKKAWSEKIKELENRVEFEKSYEFFSCDNNCKRYPFEVATEYNFTCPHCNAIMQLKDNKQLVKSLEEKIKIIQEQLEIL